MDLRRAAAALPLTLWIACAPSAAPPPAPAADAPAAHVLIVSVDGLRPDALADRARLPAYARLLDGAVTLDARCDPDWSVTLPNHVGMLTGRTAEGVEGHGWRLNDMPPPSLLLRGGQASAMHVAAAAGLATAMIAGKEKFVLFPRSWNGADAGAPDGIIHHYSWSASAPQNARALLEFWSGDATGSLAFLHFAEPDHAGHAAGWDLAPDSPYLAAVAATDGALGTVLAWLDERPARRARTAIVLTTDHGGGVPFKNHHGAERALVNRRIPFLVWHGGGAARGDLYALNPADRRAPGDADPARDEPGPPPVRNLDAADVALGLLGLPPLPRDGDRGVAPLRVLAASDR